MPLPTDTTTTAERTVEERITELRNEAARIDLDDIADPLRTSRDPAAWHIRADKRQKRRTEINVAIHDLEVWGLAVIDYPRDVSALVRAKAHGREWEFVISHATWDRGVRPVAPNPQQTLAGWLHAIQRLSRAFGQNPDENARRVLAREIDEWITARNATALAEVTALPAPDFGKGGGLPDFLRVGIYRTDLGGDPGGV